MGKGPGHAESAGRKSDDTRQARIFNMVCSFVMGECDRYFLRWILLGSNVPNYVYGDGELGGTEVRRTLPVACPDAHSNRRRFLTGIIGWLSA